MKLQSRGVLFFFCNLLSAVCTPGYKQCRRCKGYWNIVQPHRTVYRVKERKGVASGTYRFAALCELCWTELATPEARWPHYREATCYGYEDPVGNLLEIKEAVLAGG